MLKQLRLRGLNLTSSKGLLDPPIQKRGARLSRGLPAPDDYQDDAADHTNPAQDRWEIDSVFFLVRDFNRAELCVLFFGVPTQPPVGEPDDADDD